MREQLKKEAEAAKRIPYTSEALSMLADLIARQDAYIDGLIKDQAIHNVSKIYSTDSPGFDACVKAEIEQLTKRGA